MSEAQILTSPIASEQELDRLEGKLATFQVVISFDELLTNDFEGCLDIMADAVVDSPLFGFNDFAYSPAGRTDSGELLLELTGVIQRH